MAGGSNSDTGLTGAMHPHMLRLLQALDSAISAMAVEAFTRNSNASARPCSYVATFKQLLCAYKSLLMYALLNHEICWRTQNWICSL